MSFFKKLKNAVTGSDDLKRASKAQRQGLEESRGYINQFSDQARGRFDPFSGVGESSLNSIMELLNDPSALTKSAGYQFRLNEGLRGLSRNLNSRGLGVSGREYAELSDRGNLFAADELDRSINRFAIPLNAGMNATNNLANIDLTQGQLLSGNATDMGTAKANRFTNKFNFKQNLLNAGIQAGGRALAGGGG